MVLRRKWRIAACLLLCVCMAFSCVGSVYAAELVPFIVMPSLPVISSILIGSGIKPNDENDFNTLCTSIDTELQLGPISMTVLDKKTYIPTSLAKSVVEVALRQKAYSPVKSKYITVDGASYRYFENRNAAMQAFVSIFTISSVPASSTWTPVYGNIGVYCSRIDSGNVSLSWHDSSFNDISLASYVAGSDFSSSPFPVTIGDIVYCASDSKLCVTALYGNGRVTIGPFHQYPTAVGEISVRWPWEVTDDLPGVSAAGTLDSLNARWLALEREIAGLRSIPLSVPATTVAGAAAQTQTDAQSGTKTKDVAFDVVDDKAASGFFQKGKLSFALSDFFPFCIPFDIIKGVKLLVAPAKDPVFDIPIKIPYLSQQTIHVDLTKFEGLAVISRWFLTLVFVWGLAAGTSKVMKW